VHLARHAGKVLTHRALLAAVWGSNSVERRNTAVFCRPLRRNSNRRGLSRYIQTEPWVGYRLILGVNQVEVHGKLLAFPRLNFQLLCPLIHEIDVVNCALSFPLIRAWSSSGPTRLYDFFINIYSGFMAAQIQWSSREVNRPCGYPCNLCGSGCFLRSFLVALWKECNTYGLATSYAW